MLRLPRANGFRRNPHYRGEEALSVVKKLAKMPEEDRLIEGYLDLRGSGVKFLPAGIKVRGTVNFSGGKNLTFPSIEADSIDFSYASGISIGQVRTTHDFSLRGTNTKRLPSGLHVGGRLDLSDSEIKALPEGLVVGKELNLTNAKVEYFPDDIVVKGDILLSGSAIKALPKSFNTGLGIDANGVLVVAGSLDITNTNIKSLPDKMLVQGDFRASGSKIESLPTHLIVNGSLDISNTKVTVLPDNLFVGGNLVYAGTYIQKLPRNMIVGRAIRGGLNGIRSNPSGSGAVSLLQRLASLPESERTVDGTLDLVGTSITELPAGLKVKGSVDLSLTQIRSLPGGLEISGDLYLIGTPLGYAIRGLQSKNIPLTYMLGDLRINGSIIT